MNRVLVVRSTVSRSYVTGGGFTNEVVCTTSIGSFPRVTFDIDDLFDDMKRMNSFARARSWGMPVATVWKMPLPNAIRLKNRPIRIVRRVFSRALSWRRWRWRGHAGARPKRRLAG